MLSLHKIRRKDFSGRLIEECRCPLPNERNQLHLPRDIISCHLSNWKYRQKCVPLLIPHSLHLLDARGFEPFVHLARFLEKNSWRARAAAGNTDFRPSLKKIVKTLLGGSSGQSQHASRLNYQ